MDFSFRKKSDPETGLGRCTGSINRFSWRVATVTGSEETVIDLR
jgi:hypothetical protein